ncbi:MAG: sporulation protein [Haloplasmataceae bacterium]|jgi:outer membrane lipoprotein-sorting protein|nr:sporulation protein [Haloplasmataceae bacterium]
MKSFREVNVMKKIFSIVSLICAFLTLAACGAKSQEDVIKALGQKLEAVEIYEVNAMMEINEMNKTHTFDVNVKYSAPDMYKVTLSNRDSNNMQIVLKNEEAVYVLTPALNKSFKFQSDWPLNSSQPYLYQSLVKDIFNDENTIYAKQEGEYVFDTKVDYRKSRDLTSQKIVIDEKTYFPKEVTVFDSQQQPKIHVLFNDVNLKPKFNENEFAVEYSMNSAIDTYEQMPTFNPSFLIPKYTANAVLTGDKYYDEDHLNIRTFKDKSTEKTFTVIEEKVQAEETMQVVEVYGDPIVMGSGIGFLNDTSLSWFDNGIEFILSSEKYNHDELYQIANSLIIDNEK